MEPHEESQKRFNTTKLPISKQFLASLCFIMFFSSNAISFVTSKILGVYELNEYAWILTVLIIYTPLFLMPFAIGDRRNVRDFLFLWVAVILAFIVTIIIHPEYEAWFNHPLYSVSDYIFRPDRALYAYFMIRIINDPQQILKSLKTASYLIVIYGLYQFINASRLGYWLTVSEDGLMRLPYSLGFGYDMMLPAIVFLYFGMKYKKVLPLLIAGLCIFMILMAGSRAPLLWIMVFISIMVIRGFVNSKVKFIWGLIAPIILLLLANFESIVRFIASSLQQRGISARSIEMLLSGTMTDDNGRNKLFDLGLEMIKKSEFFGYGLYGDRYVIGNYFYWGYPHNIFLEILITFGLVIGSLLIIFILYHFFRIIIKCKDQYWMDLFLIFFVCSLKLLLSYSYWYVPEFWATIAVVYSWNRNQKMKNKIERTSKNE